METKDMTNNEIIEALDNIAERFGEAIPDSNDEGKAIKWGIGVLHRAKDLMEDQRKEIDRLKQWVDDLQSGMYVNCVYCGHRYGREEDTPASMADILKEHIEQCPEHPMSKLKKELEDAQVSWENAEYQYVITKHLKELIDIYGSVGALEVLDNVFDEGVETLEEIEDCLEAELIEAKTSGE